MTADRPYRRALPAEVAYKEILANSGTQFDPAVVAAFARAFRPATIEEQIAWGIVPITGANPGSPAASVA